MNNILNIYWVLLLYDMKRIVIIGGFIIIRFNFDEFKNKSSSIKMIFLILFLIY